MRIAPCVDRNPTVARSPRSSSAPHRRHSLRSISTAICSASNSNESDMTNSLHKHTPTAGTTRPTGYRERAPSSPVALARKQLACETEHRLT